MKKGAVVTVGGTGIPREMMGLPVYELAESLPFAVAAVDIEEGRPLDCDLCPISLAAKRQLNSPLAHIGKAHAYVAVPDPAGKKVEGYGRTKYVVLAAILSKSAQRLMRNVDLGTAEAVGEVITLIPRKKAEQPANKAMRNHKAKRSPSRRLLREEGVRNYSGRGWAQ